MINETFLRMLLLVLLVGAYCWPLLVSFCFLHIIACFACSFSVRFCIMLHWVTSSLCVIHTIASERLCLWWHSMHTKPQNNRTRYLGLILFYIWHLVRDFAILRWDLEILRIVARRRSSLYWCSMAKSTESVKPMSWSMSIKQYSASIGANSTSILTP